MKRRILAGAVLAILSAATAVAAPADISTVGRQAERATEDQQAMASYYKYSRDMEISEKAKPLVVQSSKVESTDPELSFEVKEVRVSKSKILTDEEIEKAIHFKGAGTTNVAELRAMVDRLNALYIEKHIQTAQAVLPPQTVRGGIVYIRLIEGTYGKTEVTGNKRVRADTLLHRIRAVHGELVDVDKLQDDLRVYNTTNVYQVRAELVPGEEEGTSDLKLHLEEKGNPMTSFIFVDNAGQYESGRYRIGAYSEYRGIGGHDAALAISPVWTRGIWGGSIMYDTPVGTHGTRMAVSYGRNIVNIIRGNFRDMDMKANSNDVALSLTHPLNVTMLSKTDLFFELHKKWSDTEILGAKLADNDTKTVKVGFSNRKFDEHGIWFAMASVTGYRSNDNKNDKKKSGSYFNAYLLRRQNISDDRYLQFRLTGQYTSHQELPVTEQFALGGMGSVRGFKESAISGDKGWSLGLEYGFPVSPDHKTWRGFVFLDYGVAYNNFSTEPTRAYIGTAGFGFEYGKGGWYGKVALGFPLAKSDNTPDDSDTRVNFYLQRSV